MDYENSSDNMFLVSMFSSSPIITIMAFIFMIIFAVKGCAQKEECSKKSCKTGSPVVIKGECVCLEKAK